MSDEATSAEGRSAPEPAAEAVARLVEEQGGRLYALGLRFCGNAEEAEDMVQETFLRAFRNWESFEGRAQVSTWLYTIASRVCQRMHRKRSGEPDHLESLEDLLPFGEARMGVIPDESEGPLEASLREEGRQRVEAAIAELPLDFRMPLVLKEIVGFRVDEVAHILEIPEATVKTRLHRARLRIRKALEEALPEREVPPAIFSRQICFDLLQAKQDCLDKRVPFEFPDQVVCERCAELFATMDLAQDVCQELAQGQLPEALRRSILERVAEASSSAG